MPAKIVTGQQLQEALARQFPLWAVQGPCLMNSTYVVASRAWVQSKFSNYMWNFQIARDQLEWKKRGNQCEHFALRAALEAVELLHWMPDADVPPEVESLAICCCKYLRSDGRGWHEVNLWFHDDVWNPWEPQTRSYFDFTPSEVNTAQQFIIP